MKARYLLTVAGALLTIGCGTDETTAPAPNEFSELDESIESYLSGQGLEGASLVIVHETEGEVYRRAYGSFSSDRISLIASASKILSAGILNRLDDDGALDIDAPIAGYLQDWGDHKPEVTAAQLVSNSAGMIGIIEDALYGPYLCMFIGEEPLQQCARDIFSADDAETRSTPDTEFRYGGGQWQLAGGLAEVVSGKSWAELVDETYSQPCGLTSTGFQNHFAQAFVGGSSLGYPSFFDGDLSALNETDNPNIEGGAYTNAEDYGKILLMHLRGGMCGENRVLSEEAVARMQEDRIAAYEGVTIDPTMPGYGMGWWNARTEPVVSDGGAYGAMPWLDLERRYGVMIILEGEATQGALLRIQVKPIIDAIFDARADAAAEER